MAGAVPDITPYFAQTYAQGMENARLQIKADLQKELAQSEAANAMARTIVGGLINVGGNIGSAAVAHALSEPLESAKAGADLFTRATGKDEGEEFERAVREAAYSKFRSDEEKAAGWLPPADKRVEIYEGPGKADVKFFMAKTNREVTAKQAQKAMEKWAKGPKDEDGQIKAPPPIASYTIGFGDETVKGHPAVKPVIEAGFEGIPYGSLPKTVRKEWEDLFGEGFDYPTRERFRADPERYGVEFKSAKWKGLYRVSEQKRLEVNEKIRDMSMRRDISLARIRAAADKNVLQAMRESDPKATNANLTPKNIAPDSKIYNGLTQYRKWGLVEENGRKYLQVNIANAADTAANGPTLVRVRTPLSQSDVYKIKNGISFAVSGSISVEDAVRWKKQLRIASNYAKSRRMIVNNYLTQRKEDQSFLGKRIFAVGLGQGNRIDVRTLHISNALQTPDDNKVPLWKKIGTVITSSKQTVHNINGRKFLGLGVDANDSTYLALMKDLKTLAAGDQENPRQHRLAATVYAGRKYARYRTLLREVTGSAVASSGGTLNITSKRGPTQSKSPSSGDANISKLSTKWKAGSVKKLNAHVTTQSYGPASKIIDSRTLRGQSSVNVTHSYQFSNGQTREYRFPNVNTQGIRRTSKLDDVVAKLKNSSGWKPFQDDLMMESFARDIVPRIKTLVSDARAISKSFTLNEFHQTVINKLGGFYTDLPKENQATIDGWIKGIWEDQGYSPTFPSEGPQGSQFVPEVESDPYSRAIEAIAAMDISDKAKGRRMDHFLSRMA